MTTTLDIQKRLAALGYYNGKLDGDLGPVSLNAIIEALSDVPAKAVTSPAMTTSAAGRSSLKQREGEKLKAYLDSVKILTIGVGHTSAAGPPNVTAGMTITAAQSDEILSRDLKTFEKAVVDSVKVPLAQHEFDALVSLAFNIGQGAFKGSSVVKRLNAGDRKGAADAILLWKNAGGKPILLKRRQAERLQFLGL